MSTYSSIFIRDALSDTGQVPSGVRTACHSPDIIPSGILPIQNFQQVLKDKWGDDIGVDTVKNSNNYFYVRGKNIGSATMSGNFRLYQATNGILIQPSQWNPIPSYQDSTVFTIATEQTAINKIAVPKQAFYWQNVPSPGADQHYCMLATFENDAVPNPMPTEDFTSLDAFVKWVTNNPNVAWRNIYIVESSVQSKTISINISNIDSESRDFTFVANCANLPEQTKVTLSCATSGINPPIFYNGFTGSTKQFSLTTPLTTLPANFADTPLIVTLEAPEGKTLDGGTCVISQDLAEDGLTHQSIKSLMRPMAPELAESIGEEQVKLVRCGQFSTVFSSAAHPSHTLLANLPIISDAHYA